MRFLEQWNLGDWRVKLYGISETNDVPDEACRAEARALAEATLPKPALTATRYGVAFVTVHQAQMFNQIIVDWWERENELRHRVFKANPETPYQFEEITATGEAFCVWELRVLAFERAAWLQHVLRADHLGDLEGYLNAVLNEDC